MRLSVFRQITISRVPNSQRCWNLILQAGRFKARAVPKKCVRMDAQNEHLPDDYLFQ